MQGESRLIKINKSKMYSYFLERGYGLPSLKVLYKIFKFKKNQNDNKKVILEFLVTLNWGVFIVLDWTK